MLKKSESLTRYGRGRAGVRLGCAALIVLAVSLLRAGAEPPVIVKLGTIDCDLVETTPIVFHGKLYRFEYVREQYAHNALKKPYFHFVDVATGTNTTPFGLGLHLGFALVDGDSIYVYGVPTWGADKMTVCVSKDLEHWQEQPALDLPGWSMFNMSVCKGRDRYVMAIEIDKPVDQAGAPFSARFATSKDLLHWELTPPECVYTKEKYSACPTIRYYDDYNYMVYLESYPGAWEPHIVRSKDLKSWESSPYNPIMRHSDDDRKIANPKFTDAEKKRIASAENANNSDVDFAEFQGKTVIYYSWGNQHGVEHLAEAEFAGTEKAFLTGFFPKETDHAK